MAVNSITHAVNCKCRSHAQILQDNCGIYTLASKDKNVPLSAREGLKGGLGLEHSVVQAL